MAAHVPRHTRRAPTRWTRRASRTSPPTSCSSRLDAAAPFPRLRTDRQADWLAALGIDDLVAEGRRRWEAGAARGELEALAGRSRITEAAALTDPDGLGAHHVVLYGAGGAGRTSPGERRETGLRERDRRGAGVTSLRGHG